MASNNPLFWTPGQLIAGASNVMTGDNPPYANADFYKWFPQFQGTIDDGIVTQFVAMANATVLQQRWQADWQMAMGWFIAHFCTLYMQAMAGTNPTASQVVAAAQSRGLQTSKSVGDVSVNYDFSHITEDLKGWAMFTTTIFGQLYAQKAEYLSKAGLFVW